MAELDEKRYSISEVSDLVDSMDRFLERLRKLRNGSTREILDGLYKAVMEHLGGSDPHSRQQDDITLVVLKVEE